MAVVYIKPGDNVEVCIKRFRKEVDKESILKELKERQFFKKPALKRKIEKNKLEKRIKKNMRKRRRMARSIYQTS